MSEQGGTGLQRAAEGAFLQVAARYGIVLICAIALPAGAWIGTRLVGQLDEVAKVVNVLSTDVAVMKNDISYLKQK